MAFYRFLYYQVLYRGPRPSGTMRLAFRMVLMPMRDGQAGHLRNIGKLIRIGNAGRVVQSYKSCAGVNAGTGFVETDMTIVTNAQDLQVDTTGFFDLLLILACNAP